MNVAGGPWVLCEECGGKAPLVPCEACEHRGIVEPNDLGYTHEDMAKVVIEVEFSMPSVHLNLHEVFPDGLPEGVKLSELSAKHIIEAMKEDGSKSAVLSNWDLLSMGDIEIDVHMIDIDGKRTDSSW